DLEHPYVEERWLLHFTSHSGPRARASPASPSAMESRMLLVLRLLGGNPLTSTNLNGYSPWDESVSCSRSWPWSSEPTSRCTTTPRRRSTTSWFWWTTSPRRFTAGSTRPRRRPSGPHGRQEGEATLAPTYRSAAAPHRGGRPRPL